MPRNGNIRSILACSALLSLAACVGERAASREPRGSHQEGAGALATRAVSAKHELWKEPARFRGFNLDYWSSSTDYVKTADDIRALKATGANLAKIGIYGGFCGSEPPYARKEENWEALRRLVSWCEEEGLAFTIDVRGGPGRADVSDGKVDALWTDEHAQARYASMLRELAAIHAQRELCVGISPIVEPTPLAELVESGEAAHPERLGELLAAAGIDLGALYASFIREIRTVSADIPVIVQGPCWSSPEWWGLVERQEDPFIVYEVHSYVPYEYSHAERPWAPGLAYPLRWWSQAAGAYIRLGRRSLEATVFAAVTAFQERHGVPILLGEFGMRHPQEGGVAFLSDIQDIALSRGWHHCLWAFRPNDPAVKDAGEFDPLKWGPEYRREVLGWFAASPPSP